MSVTRYFPTVDAAETAVAILDGFGIAATIGAATSVWHPAGADVAEWPVTADIPAATLIRHVMADEAVDELEPDYQDRGDSTWWGDRNLGGRRDE